MNSAPSEANWFKSSYSGGQTDCVEVAWLAPGSVGIRDSKNPTGPTLTVSPAAWDTFTALVTSGTLPTGS
ncbi:DUF397 domain-containing protein [Nocardia sp. NBC_00511]|uniref:DUF397 domain-containing protein n=1 Tax=Nocardia sp. NBC_00511 TaxID=2903591 RepID=UPI0030E5D276